MQSRKYGRTYHYPFSPGTTSDDRINDDYWCDLVTINHVIHTEKLDGENNCLNQYGVFARSHAAPTQSLWTQQLRQRWQLIKNDLHDIELFGENLYAIHSIEYHQIEQYFFLFAVRQKDMWLSWPEVKFYAELFDFCTVPEVTIVSDLSSENQYRQAVIDAASQPSRFESWDVAKHQPCSMEGIVCRNYDEFAVETFKQNVFKYVRKNHVKTDVHWRKSWQRAKLAYEWHDEREKNS